MNAHGASLFTPPLADIRFIIEHWLDAPADWRGIPAFASLDAETAAQVVAAAGAFCADVLAPINSNADRQGCRFTQGCVCTPQGFREAYTAYVDAGWPALACEADAGGHGLPQLLDAALHEMTAASNHAWAMYPGILYGACACLQTHADEWLRQVFLPPLVSGRWLATMCLTEPQAGSDLGRVRTLAHPQEDGSYQLEGGKIFVSGGEHDLTENIVHLVLARMPGAPAGTRGLSLFLSPKIIPDLADSGARACPQTNRIVCDGIETKMGIKGSATCSLHFERAKAWLVGQPGKGLAAMFTMMNSARLRVGLQGLGHAEMACQLAYAYARERRQMRALPRPEGADAAADPIACHPPVHRILLQLRVWSEGMRAIAYWAAHQLDLARHAPRQEARTQAHALASLLTPIIKAFFTERGFQLASEALQVFGGYGYIHEYRIEQVLRDVRITMIYEGTNQIQAIDLMRKALAAEEDGLAPLLRAFRDEARACIGQDPHAGFGEMLLDWSERIETLTRSLHAGGAHDPGHAARCAEDYLRLLGTVCLAFAWARAARVSATGNDFPGKRSSADYVFRHVLPEAEHWARRIAAAVQPYPALAPA